MDVSDLTLFRRWQRRRDPQAFKEIVARHAGMVYGTCRRILQDATDAEDVTQDCFVYLAKSRRGATRSLGAWLHKVAASRSLDRIRSTNRRLERETRYAATRDAVDEPEWDDVRDMVDEAIAALPDDLRDAVVGFFLEGRTQTALSETLGVPRTTLQRRIDRGIERIRSALRSRGVSVSGAALTALLQANASSALPAGLVASLGKIAVSGYGGTVADSLFASFQSKLVVAGMVVFALMVPAAYYTMRDAAAPAAVAEPAAPTQSAASIEADPTATEPLSTTVTTNPAVSTVAVADSAIAAEDEATVGARIFGRVVDLEGRAQQGIHVRGRGEGESFAFNQSAYVHTDANGGFEITEIAPTKLYSVQAFREEGETVGRSPQIDLRDLDADDEIEVELVMHEASIAGQVVDPSGRPVPNAEVLAQPEAPIKFGLPAGQADAQGRFYLPGLFAGDFVVKAKAAAGSQWPDTGKPLTIQPTQRIKHLRVQLEGDDPYFITGRVTNTQSNPIEGAHVKAHLAGPPHTSRWTGTDAEGRYTLLLPGEGPYNMWVTHLDYAQQFTRAIQAGEERDFALAPRGAVAGRVIDMATGEPIREFAVLEQVPISDENWWMVSDDFVERNDPEGRFRAERIEPGEKEIVVRAEGYAEARIAVTVAPGETTDDVVVLLERGRALAGLVTDAGGAPVAGALVFLDTLPPLHERSQKAVGKTSREGAFELERVPTDAETIYAVHPDFAPAWADLSATDEAVGIVMEPGGRIEVAVFDGGEPLAGASVWIMYPANQDYVAGNTTSTNGWAAIDTLPRGEAILAVGDTHDGELTTRHLYLPVDVTNSATIDVNLSFDSGNSVLLGTISEGVAPLTGNGVELRYELADGLIQTIETYTLSDGRYLFEGVPSGRATLRVFVSGDDVIERSVVLAADGAIREDVTL